MAIPTVSYTDNQHSLHVEAHNDDHGLVALLLVTIRGWLRGRKYRVERAAAAVCQLTEVLRVLDPAAAPA